MILENDLNYKILFVDDEINNLSALKRNLKKYFNIDFASNGKEALSIVKASKEEFAVIISDIYMPVMTGIELLEKVKKIYPETISILITGNPDVETAIDAVNRIDAFQYLTKPFRLNVLKTAIELAIRKYKSRLDLYNKSIRDGLTKLYNHIHIVHLLEREINKTKRKGDKFSIILFDLDNFKSVNDTFGHRIGDDVLVKVSDIMINKVRNVDSVGRYGGEEFLIILPETELNKAFVIAERIRKGIKEIEWNVEGIKVTISGGCADYEGEDINEFINKADRLLYKAKQNGKNKIEAG